MQILIGGRSHIEIISYTKLHINIWMFVSWRKWQRERWFSPFWFCPVNCQCPWKKTLTEKNEWNTVLTKLPSWYLPVQSLQWNHQNNVCNLYTVNNKDTRTTSWHPSYVIFNQQEVKWSLHRGCFKADHSNNKKKPKLLLGWI